ncbi:MAG TPA: restriction endonuclease subunit S [Microthrixaceae bacterium]|nr:restriction endonuclease subunit S [Microthrixaceae bacterium]
MSDFPAGWELAELGDVVEVLDSRRVPVNAKERAVRPGDVPYYGATGQVGWIDEALFNEELVLLGEDGAPFLDPAKPKAYLVDGPSWVNNHAHVLRALDGVTTNRFLRYALDAADYRPHVNGTTRLKLTKKAMCAMPMRVPPLAEQERIVAALDEHLSRLDVAGSALVSARRRLALLAGAAMETAFAAKSAPVLPIGDVATVGSGSTPKRTDSRYWDHGAVPWVTSGALNSVVVREPSAFITEAALKETSVKLWPAGTILVAMYGEGRTRGRAAELAFASTCNQACAAIQPDPSVLRPSFLRWFLNSRYQQNRRLASGGVQPNLSLGLVRAMAVPVPSLHEQDEIVASLELSSELLKHLAEELRVGRVRSESLRRSVLAAAFSGQLVPQNHDDEPASVLLDRIRAERQAEPARTRRARS